MNDVTKDQTAQSDSTRRLSIPVMAAFGSGELGTAVVTIGLYSLLLFYYQQIVGLSGTLTGLALGIALFCDAVTDPLVGSLSDRVKSKYGRRHPVMAASAIPIAITLFALFNPPDGLSAIGSFAWLTVFAILVRTALTFFVIPHLALGAEMTPDYLQRSTLYSFGALIGGVGGALIGFAVYWVLFPTTDEFSPGLLNAEGYRTFTLAAGIILIASIGLCALGTAGEIPNLKAPEAGASFSFLGMVRDMRDVFRDRDFLVIFAGFLLWYIFGYIESVGSPFLNLHFWGLQTEELAYFGVTALLGLPVAFALVPWVTRTFDKRNTMIGSSLAFLILPNIPICLRLMDVSWYPANSSPWILYINLGVSLLNAVTGTIAAVTYSSIYADLTDSHEYRTHQRREGTIFAARSFSGKAAGAFGLMIGGAILDLIAFPENAPYGSVPDEVIWNLGFFVGPATSFFSAAGVALFLLYRLDKARHATIARELRARQAP
ncbi:MAG: MFS transporter [Gammaproteobacteria bacterium]|nr:MFS transporter [Gammaproteobacteria bacterium]